MSGKKEKVSSKKKGDVVEEIVAMMHEAPDVRVLRDVQLPAADASGRTRQFDMLVVGTFAGYESVLAIECKNYARNLNVKDVDSYRGQLEDVGYAPQQGILVTAGKIGAGAHSRARSLGLKVFEFEGLNPDRLSSAVHEARQRIVFAILLVVDLKVVGGAGPDATVEEAATFFDAEGNLVGVLPDLVWLKWLSGEPPSTLGEHEVDLEPEGWYSRVGGEFVPVFSAGARVKVLGATVVIPGKATGHALVNPDGPAVQKFKAKASFGATPGQHPVRIFEGEEGLEAFLEGNKGAFSLTVGRVRVPRLRLKHVYWPPSQRVVDKMRELGRAHEAGTGPPLDPDALEGIEGTDLGVAWEPISSEYLILARAEGAEDES